VFVLTNEQVEADAGRVAGWLAARGARPGDRVAVVASNHPGYVPLVLGALRTGVVPVLVNVHLAPAERDRILADADPLLVVDDSHWPTFEDAEPAELAPYPLARPMHYTSGTTGESKGVWSGLLSGQDSAALVADERELWAPDPGGTYLVCSPLYHSAPLRSATSALLAGARVVVFEQFDAQAVADAFATQGVTGAFLVPTHLRRLLAGPFAAPDARRVLHAGEPCAESLKRRAMDVFPPGTLWEFYGSTEGQFTVCPPGEWLDHPGTLGRARRGRRLSIHEPDPDGVGQIYVTAPSFARWEYWRDPAKTEEAWDGDSFTVRDVGRLDDDGYLYMAGRREDLIISGGVNVYPAEVERVLLSHPDVVEAAVFGVDDPEWGQRVCAAVVADTDADSLRAWARERLPGSHAPKQFLTLEALPRTGSGKVRRADLTRLVEP
jgi:acyl-CoA synthetase (AMP-forming)/AMP-acid ligase II